MRSRIYSRQLEDWLSLDAIAGSMRSCFSAHRGRLNLPIENNSRRYRKAQPSQSKFRRSRARSEAVLSAAGLASFVRLKKAAWTIWSSWTSEAPASAGLW